jgi:Kdo2-lipid IVA lauroyltransferase/acyltransferase
MTTLFRLLSKLPLAWLHRMGAVLGVVVYLASGKYRQRLKANAAQAGYAGIHWAAAREAGKMVMELPYLWLRHGSSTAATQARVFGFEHVQAALDAKRGIIILTPHLGCFELCAQVPALHMPITVLYRSHKKAVMREVIESFRPRHNLSTAPADLSGVRHLLRTLKLGGATGLLPDQVPAAGDGQGSGVLADWFGKPAITMTFPAKLIAMSKATVLLVWTKRLPDGAGYEIFFAPFDQTLSKDTAQAATQINHAMQDLIKQCPTQYLWAYDRYKGANNSDLPIL